MGRGRKKVRRSRGGRNRTKQVHDEEWTTRENGRQQQQKNDKLQLTYSHGSMPRERTDDEITICSTNVGKLPANEYNNDKTTMMIKWFQQMQADIAGVSEVGINYSAKQTRKSFREMTIGRGWQGDCIQSHNMHDTREGKVQPGGVGILISRRIGHLVKDKGRDTRELGRYVWVEIQGINGAKIRLYQIYRPLFHPKLEWSVYRQQRNFLLAKGIETDPRDQLLEDISEEVRPLLGTKILIMGDFNEEVADLDWHQWFDGRNIRERIFESVGENIGTHIRNESAKQIDGIASDFELESAGLTDFGPWDHRTLWGYVSLSGTFGYSYKPPRPRQVRRLRFNKPLSVENYHAVLTKQLKATNLLNQVMTVTYATPIEEATEVLNRCDKIRSDIMRAAEKQCRHISRGEVPFSPAIAFLGKRIHALKLMIRFKSQPNHISPRRLDRMAKASLIDKNWREWTLADTQRELNESENHYKAVKGSGVELRNTHLQGLYEAAKRKGNEKKAAEIKDIIRREQVKRFHAEIGWNYRPKCEGMFKVKKKDRNGLWQEFYEEEKIVEICADSNKDKYTQAFGTALMTPEWQRRLGRAGETEFAQRILKGEVRDDELRDIPEGARLLLHELQAPSDMTPVVDRITPQVNTQDWRSVDEMTSSSPSGLHIGLWKANSLHPVMNQIDAAFRDLCYNRGIILDRWRKGLDVELYKEIGNCDVNRLRTIVLVEADWNMNCKFMGRRIMRQMADHAEDTAWNAPEQFGSKKAHSAQDLCLNIKLIDDIMRMTHTNGAFISNDAKSCYDRIGHAVMSLALQRLGIPLTTVESMVEVFHTMKHHLRTGFGDSEFFYVGDADRPLQGILQGNGASPAVWAAVSTPIINLLRKLGGGVSGRTPITKKKLEVVSFSFVDDTTLPHARFGSIDEYPERRLQRFSDIWDEAIDATGGMISATKSTAQVVKFNSLRSNEWSYRHNKEEVNITMVQDGTRVKLEAFNPDEANRVLGNYLRRDGKDVDIQKYLLEKVRKWAATTRSGWWGRDKMWSALTGRIWKGIEYVLPCSGLSSAACRRISAKALKVSLPRMGICGYANRTALYSTHEGYGMGLMSVHMLQTMMKLQIFHRHWGTDTTTGDLLQYSYETWATSLGTCSPHRLTSRERRLLAEDNWWESLFRDVGEYKMECQLVTGLERQEDEVILRVLPWLTEDQIRQFNWVRLFFGITTMDDLIDANGNVHRRLLRKPKKTDAIQQGQFPITKPPSRKPFLLWEKIIKRLARENRGGRIDTRVESPARGLRSEAAVSRQIHLCTDGGICDGIGSAGIVIVTGRRKIELQTIVPRSGPPMSSYRCELGGLLCGFQWIRQHGYKEVRYCCDNDSALQAPFRAIGHKDSDVDLKRSIQWVIRDMSCQMEFVKGHADELREFEDCTYWEKLNIRADALATDAGVQYHRGRPVPRLEISLAPGHIVLHNTVISSFSRHHMHRLLNTNLQEEQITRMLKLTHVQYRSIRWDWVRHTQKKNSPGLRRWLFKVIHKAVPVRRRLFVRQEIDSDTCLFCDNQDNEFHFLTCRRHHQARAFFWSQCMRRLEEARIPLETRQRFRDCIRGHPHEDDNVQHGLGLPATVVGMWATDWGLDRSSRYYISRRTKMQQIIQTTARIMYNHHVTQTYQEQHGRQKQELDEYIIQKWDDCQIPDTETSYHPDKTEVDFLLQQSTNVKQMWKDMHDAYASFLVMR